MPNPPRIPLEEMTLRQLRRVASDYEVSRYSRMRKVELIASIQQKQTAAGVAPTPVSISAVDGQTEIEASKFSTPAEPAAMEPTIEKLTVEELATVDHGLGELPSGYGESRIVLLPRDPQWAYVYWDIPNEHKEQLRHQGGSRLALRFYDVTDVDLDCQSPHSLQQYECDEMSRDWHLPIPVSDRDYIVEIGYVCNDGRWLILARSAPVRVPPVYPSDWIEDHFMTIESNEELRGRTVMQLVPPSHRESAAAAAAATAAAAARGDGTNPLYDEIFAQTQSAEAMRVAGSLFGSMQQAQMPESVVSSYVFPSGAGLWALPTASGINMSGAGFSASAPPMRPRKFWLIADAELIVYGATEPDATVTVGGKPIKLNADGTFRFQMSFQDGVIDYPIVAVAADGEQSRSVHMNFERQTPSRHTNTKDEAVEEWFA